MVTKCFHSTVDMAFFLVESVMVLTALLYTQYQVLPLYQKELGIFGLGAFKLLFYMTLQEKKKHCQSELYPSKMYSFNN